MRKPLYIFGNGGHARVILDCVLEAGDYEFKGFIVPSHEVEERRGDLPLIVETEFLPAPGDTAVVGIGDNAVRGRILTKLTHRYPQLRLATIVHPLAYVARNAELAPGVVCFAGSVVQPGAVIATNVILNTGAIIDHDCAIGAHASLAPGCCLGGAASVGEYSALGIGASVLHGRAVGRDTVVGAGAVVTNDIPDNVVAVGVPCRVVRTRHHGDRYL